MLTPRERGVLSLLREGLTDEQIAERLDLDVATVQYDVWGVLSKLGLATREEAPAWQPEVQPVPEPEPEPEPAPAEPGPVGRDAAPVGPLRRFPLRRAAQGLGIGLALAGLGLMAWGALRLGDGERELSLAVQTPASSPAETTPAGTTPGSTISPFPTVVAEEPFAYGQFGWRRALYSIRPDGSELFALLPRPPRAYAWSPDGTQLAYIQSYGDIDLKFISAGGDALHSIRLDGVFSVDSLSWPPAGSRILLNVQVAGAPDASGQATLTNAIAVLDVQGGGVSILESVPQTPDGLITLPGDPAARVPHPGSGAVLSPDGAYVAYPSGDGHVLVAPANGEAPAAVVAGHLPAWSADGSRLAFQAGAEIHIVKRDGFGEQVLTTGVQPAWAPSNSIAFIRDGNLFVIDPDSGEETQLTGIVLPFAASPRWSPDGERILFTYAASVSEIFTVAPNGEERTLLVPGSYPQWSPDGGSIAFAAGSGGGPAFGGALYIMTADAGDITALPAGIFLSDAISLDTGCYSRPIQWSPIGDQIALCNGQSGTIEIVGLNGESPVPVGSGSSFSWSPEGTRIAFAGIEGEGVEARPVIYIADLAQPDAPPQRLAEGTTPDWSPDGSKIAYIADDGLHVVDLPTGQDGVLAGGEVTRSHVAWAPDGSRLAYVSAGRIFVAALGSADPPLVIADGLGPKWSPDATQIAYYTGAGNEDLWVVPTDASAPPRHLGKGRSPAWSPDSAHIAYDRFTP